VQKSPKAILNLGRVILKPEIDEAIGGNRHKINPDK
jgi:hypothetical protein